MTCTGYTHGITDGTVKTPKDFLKLCLKAFGCCIELRDESLSSFNANEYINELKNRGTSDYLKESLDEAEKGLEKLLKKTESEWKKDLDTEIAEAEKHLEKNKKAYEEETKLLTYFTTTIEKWNCSSEYQNIKDFALQQLSITEPDNYDWEEKELEELRNTDVKEYRNRHIQSEIKSVDYYKKEIEHEKESLNKNIAFLEGFIKEIENIQ